MSRRTDYGGNVAPTAGSLVDYAASGTPDALAVPVMPTHRKRSELEPSAQPTPPNGAAPRVAVPCLV